MSDSDEPETISCREYHPANWWTALGVYRKRAIIEARGIPDMTHWRFVTLTLDQSRFDYDPALAYRKAKRRFAKFLEGLRDEYGDIEYCWKKEFHKNGWVHWHLCVNVRRRVEISLWSKLWGYGRVDVRMIRPWDENGRNFEYLFKYATKAAGNLPDWYLDHFSRVPPKRTKNGEVARRPESFGRERFWGTSKGFYTGESVPVEREEPKTCLVPQTARDAVESLRSKFQIVARKAGGRYVQSAVVEFDNSQEFRAMLGHACRLGFGAILWTDEYIAPVEILESYIKRSWLLKLQALQRRNRQSLSQAKAAWQIRQLARTPF